jgi:tetratricopeptide (TPR) repeat protein
MQERRLTLVREEDADAPGSGRGFALFAALLLGSAAVLATLVGADEARRSIPAREIGTAAINRSLEVGSADPEVRDAVVGLRRALGRRPLDSGTRIVYASVLLGLSRSLDDVRAAAFHADLAAQIAPVTVPVVSSATLVLARGRETGASVDWVRRMFGHDAPEAARALSRIEPFLSPDQLETALPPAPVAYLAWESRLRGDGRESDAELVLDRARSRWPDHPEILRRSASRALARRDYEALAALFPPDLVLPEEAASAPVLTFRARAAALRGDRESAREDLELALRLAGDRGEVRILAGDVFVVIEELDRARNLWNRELFLIAPEFPDRRVRVLRRLARLEERAGKGGAALRHWREVLKIATDDPEARTRVGALTGARF